MSRVTCQSCFRPIPVCFCSVLVSLTNKLKIIILQHPLEQKHPFNTGKIVELCLSNCEIILGEKFDIDTLNSVLSTPSALLYPSLSWLPNVEQITTKNKYTKIEQLIVIDASWRKSKKILHLNSLLQTIPRLTLTGNSKSNYDIRVSNISDGLSTIESIVVAFQQLEPELKPDKLLTPFLSMVEKQKRYCQRDFTS